MRLPPVRIFVVVTDDSRADFDEARSARKLTSRPKPERIGDESLTPPFSLFVHGQIWWHHQVRTLDAESATELFARPLASALIFWDSGGVKPKRPMAACRSKAERIADESATSRLSLFVHRNILYLNDFLTINAIFGDDGNESTNQVSSHFRSLTGNKNRQYVFLVHPNCG